MITLAGLRERTARLVQNDLVVVPVRHHSPACALHVGRLIAERRPSVVLIEGPSSFDPLVDLLADADAQAPFAVYCWARLRIPYADPGQEDARRAAFYPFCDYSPELVAVRAARAEEIPVRFIDLDHDAQCRLELAAPGTVEPDATAASLLDERHLRRSRYLQDLARRMGCRDHEELWEHLFEVPAAELASEEQIHRVAGYCALARHDATDDELAADGTLAREQEMAFFVRQALDARAPGDGPVLAVVGGFHATALVDRLDAPCVRPEIHGPEVVHADRALVRYAFERLERLNGYAAGMTSPQWHQRVWNGLRDPATSADARREAALGMLWDVADELRRDRDIAVPMPALTAAFEHAQRLAHLRNRTEPVACDLTDAVRSCFVKGDADADGALIQAIAGRAMVGTAVGKVPLGTHTPPLVRDFQERARRQRLQIDDTQPRRVALDLYRRPEHRRTSRLLHGLTLLDVPFAHRTAGPDFVQGTGLDRLQEHWEYAFHPACEAALIEASVHGSTVAEAVAVRFAASCRSLVDEGRGNDARAAARLLTQACVLGLHAQTADVLALLQRSIAGDGSFDAVVAALSTMALLFGSREPLEARGLDELPELLRDTYRRAVFLGRQGLGETKTAEAYVRALVQLRDLLVGRTEADSGLDAALFDEALFDDLVAEARTHHAAPIVRGAALGLLYGEGRVESGEVAEAIAGQLAGQSAIGVALEFLRGLLETAREIAWQEPEVVRHLDAWLTGFDQDRFVRSLPELRLAFSSMTPAETDRIANLVEGLHGARLDRTARLDVSAADVQANLELTARVHAVMRGDGLAIWLTEAGR